MVTKATRPAKTATDAPTRRAGPLFYGDRLTNGEIMRILVIEDDRTTGDYILQGLREEGHAADLCRNGREGLIVAQTSDFDVLVVDRMLPDLDGLSLVRFDTNRYSVPVAHARRPITVVATVDEVRLIDAGQLVARHPRCWKREQEVYDPVHYLALLEKKPGGLDHAKPLEDWGLPRCFDELRRLLEADGLGTREFIRVLRLLERFELHELTSAVEYALDIGVIDSGAIRVIAEHRSEEPVALFSLDGRPHLRMIDVPTTDVSAYGALLTAGLEGGAS